MRHQRTSKVYRVKNAFRFFFLLSCASTVSCFKLLERTCDKETGSGSLAHEHVLDRLNGRKLILIGDSVSRYQYLELAFYVLFGKCPDKDSSNYILSERTYSTDLGTRDWAKFYAETSKQLNVKSTKFSSTETCFCARLSLSPGSVIEQRAFQYTDIQVRANTTPGCTQRPYCIVMRMYISIMFLQPCHRRACTVECGSQGGDTAYLCRMGKGIIIRDNSEI
jgi:hypothetical protein